MRNLKGFIIHLERAKKRLHNVEVLQATLPFKTEIISAVDSQKLNTLDIETVYQRRKYKPNYPFELSLNEIACFLSHRKAWQAIIDQRLDGALIIEDDIKLNSDFKMALDFSLTHFEPEHFIRFPLRMSEKGQTIISSGPHNLILAYPVGLGQMVQLVGYKAAEKLLEATKNFDRPVDTTMQLFWETGVHPFSILPNGISEISANLGGSTIQSKQKIGNKLRREVSRFLYRFKISRLSTKKDTTKKHG